MLSFGLQGRSRAQRRALDVARRAPLSGSARTRIAEALERCPARLRHMVALLLVERLTETEVAATLGISIREVSRAHDALRSELRRTLRGFGFRPPRVVRRRARLVETATLRKAS